MISWYKLFLAPWLFLLISYIVGAYTPFGVGKFRPEVDGVPFTILLILYILPIMIGYQGRKTLKLLIDLFLYYFAINIVYIILWSSDPKPYQCVSIIQYSTIENHFNINTVVYGEGILIFGLLFWLIAVVKKVCYTRQLVELESVEVQ